MGLQKSKREKISSKERQTSALARRFKNEPTLENYINLRRNYPNVPIEVAIHGGIDPLFYMERELAHYGINANDMASVFDADQNAISKIALLVIEKLIDRRRLQKAGNTHLVRRGRTIPDNLIDWVINSCLDSLSWNDDLRIPRDLIILIRERLGGPNSEYVKGAYTYHLRSNAALAGGQLKAQGIKPTYKILGKIMNVAPSTVMRWFAPGEFERQTDIYANWFDSKGNLIGLRHSKLRRK